jgi:hypothetical protein
VYVYASVGILGILLILASLHCCFSATLSPLTFADVPGVVDVRPVDGIHAFAGSLLLLTSLL